MAPIGAESRRLCVAAAGTSCPAAEKVLTAAADAAGLSPQWRPGALVAVLGPPATPADRFLRALDTELRAHNATQDRLRLRVALHEGSTPEVRHLLTAPVLVDALDEAPDANLAVLLSDRIPGAAQPPECHEVLLRGNDIAVSPRAWLWLPGWRPGAAERRSGEFDGDRDWVAQGVAHRG
ncbi:hypothetical protein [Actinokineospora diospyrosa]|uniref:Uncharacterized protein n=1 Tax=Actinokineospora diospyrosa TaxID=103728 RepID=A0ABT1IK58_9PSEU|nr:hypothetical protein [Actinokineospora diospyrosa]MCP2273037.1 hypothetical protein [Actinokineospora diospyrosa]